MTSHNQFSSFLSTNNYFKIYFNQGLSWWENKNFIIRLEELEKIGKYNNNIWEDCNINNLIEIEFAKAELHLDQCHLLKLIRSKLINNGIEFEIDVKSKYVIPKIFYTGTLDIYPNNFNNIPLGLTLLTVTDKVKKVKAKVSNNRKVTPHIKRKESIKNNLISRQTKDEKIRMKKYRSQRKKQRYKKNLKVRKHRKYLKKKFKKRNLLYQIILLICIFAKLIRFI